MYERLLVNNCKSDDDAESWDYMRLVKYKGNPYLSDKMVAKFSINKSSVMNVSEWNCV